MELCETQASSPAKMDQDARDRSLREQNELVLDNLEKHAVTRTFTPGLVERIVLLSPGLLDAPAATP
jgi:hypothetical protein